MKRILIQMLSLLSISTIDAQEALQRLLIEDVNVIPMHIHTVLEHKDVVIENGEITQVRPHTDQDTSTYNLGRIDGRNKFLVPSFSDAHVHLPEQEDLAHFFLMNIMNGVTSLRSMRGAPWHLEIDQQAEFTPKLYLSSPPIHRSDSISPRKAEQLIANYQKAGFDFVKILSVKDQNTFDYLAGASKKYNFPLAGHCPSNISIFSLSNSNTFQSIEHLSGFFSLPDIESIKIAIDRTINAQIYHCPTLDWYYTGQVKESDLRKRAGVAFLPKKWINKWEEKIAAHLAESTAEGQEKERKISKQRFDTRLLYLGFIYRQGGLLLLSSDASGIYGIPGYGIHTEMQHYAQAKISNYDILKSTCYNLSAMFGEQHTWGTIKAGVYSDLVLLNSNPLDDIKNTTDIQGIIFKGKYYLQDDLKEQLKKLKD
ncbi:amidohydrolase family protein [Aureispira anguillae]|uniref:Amidohydrolase family protein n=1 Tax=Aureispira anguillae TaxID=2864201 RepID=A0A916DRL5_9BACT|nr:amidohydrolase family protein [Aureispira anguillae]BDS10286.1 amidohydrolase family protein [Aureispira anguillae]